MMRQPKALFPWMLVRLCAVVLIALVAGASLLYGFARHEQVAQGQQANADLLQQASHIVDSMLEGVRHNAMMLAQSETVVQLLHFDDNVAAAHLMVRAQFESLRTTNRMIDSIYLLRYANRRVLASGSEWGTGYYLWDEFGDDNLSAMRRSGWLLSPGVDGTNAAEQAVVSFCLELPMDSRDKDGALVLNLHAQSLRNLITKATSPMSGAVQIVTSAGETVLGELGVDGLAALQAALAEAPVQGSFEIDIDGEACHLFYMHSGYMDWIYFTTTPDRLLFAPARRLLVGTLVAILAMLGISGIMLYATSVRVVRPIRGLVTRLTNGEQPAEGSAFAELQAIEASWRALSEQKERYAGEANDQLTMRRRNAMVALMLGEPCDLEMLEALNAEFSDGMAYQVAMLDIDGRDAALPEHFARDLSQWCIGHAWALSPAHAVALLGVPRDLDVETAEQWLLDWAAGQDVRIGLSLRRSALSQLHGAYQEAVTMLAQTAQSGQSLMAYRVAMAQTAARQDLRQYDRLTRAVHDRIMDWDAAAAQQLTLQYCGRLTGDDGLTVVDQRMLALQLANTIWLSVRDVMPDVLWPQAHEMLTARSVAAMEVCMLALLQRFEELAPSKEENHVARRIIEYVDSAFREPLGIEGMAQRFQMSSTTFCTLFKEATGATFLDFLTRKRLEEACRLLRETEIKATAVAEQVGFGNQQNMLRAFRKQMGTTPTQYRALQHAQTEQ